MKDASKALESAEGEIVKDPKQSLMTMKSRWRKEVRRLDQHIMSLANDDRRGGMTVGLVEYKKAARRVLKMGQRGEDLLEQAVNLGMGPIIISDLRDVLTVVGDWGARIFKIVMLKWGSEPSDWPLYQCHVAETAELISQSNSIRELEKLEAELDADAS